MSIEIPIFKLNNEQFLSIAKKPLRPRLSSMLKNMSPKERVKLRNRFVPNGSFFIEHSTEYRNKVGLKDKCTVKFKIADNGDFEEIYTNYYNKQPAINTPSGQVVHKCNNGEYTLSAQGRHEDSENGPSFSGTLITESPNKYIFTEGRILAQSLFFHNPSIIQNMEITGRCGFDIKKNQIKIDSKTTYNVTINSDRNISDTFVGTLHTDGYPNIGVFTRFNSPGNIKYTAVGKFYRRLGHTPAMCDGTLTSKTEQATGPGIAIPHDTHPYITQYTNILNRNTNKSYNVQFINNNKQMKINCQSNNGTVKFEFTGIEHTFLMNPRVHILEGTLETTTSNNGKLKKEVFKNTIFLKSDIVDKGIVRPYVKLNNNKYGYGPCDENGLLSGDGEIIFLHTSKSPDTERDFKPYELGYTMKGEFKDGKLMCGKISVYDPKEIYYVEDGKIISFLKDDKMIPAKPNHTFSFFCEGGPEDPLTSKKCIIDQDLKIRTTPLILPEGIKVVLKEEETSSGHTVYQYEVILDNKEFEQIPFEHFPLTGSTSVANKLPKNLLCVLDNNLMPVNIYELDIDKKKLEMLYGEGDINKENKEYLLTYVIATSISKQIQDLKDKQNDAKHIPIITQATPINLSNSHPVLPNLNN